MKMSMDARSLNSIILARMIQVETTIKYFFRGVLTGYLWPRAVCDLTGFSFPPDRSICKSLRWKIPCTWPEKPWPGTLARTWRGGPSALGLS